MKALKYIAKIQTDFPTKFGIPRQSGLVNTKGTIVFEPEYRKEEALKGLEECSHLWLIWEFSEAVRTGWSPTVRPPRLGGNKRCGVFATRSPFRPNPIGLSCVKMTGMKKHPEKGMVIEVEGADLMDGTPIFDIKPYLPYADSYPEARGGFTDGTEARHVIVELPEELATASGIPGEKLQALRGVLEQDPRPRYQKDPQRIYGMSFGEYEVKFTVREDVLRVVELVQREI